MNLHLFFTIAACICFGLAAPAANPPRLRPTPLGLLFLTLAFAALR